MTITPKMKSVFKQVYENNRPVSVAMRENGYSVQTCTKPKNVTETEGWKELLRQSLPDAFLLKRHRSLLNKKDPEGEPDTQSVSKGLDMAYKLKGSYAPDKHESTTLDITTLLCSIIEGEKE